MHLVANEINIMSDETTTPTTPVVEETTDGTTVPAEPTTPVEPATEEVTA